MADKSIGNTVFNVKIAIPIQLIEDAVQAIDAGGDGVIPDDQKISAIKASLEGEAILDEITEELLYAFHRVTASSKKKKVKIEVEWD